jgi:hypothetical protein
VKPALPNPHITVAVPLRETFPAIEFSRYRNFDSLFESKRPSVVAILGH